MKFMCIGNLYSSVTIGRIFITETKRRTFQRRRPGRILLRFFSIADLLTKRYDASETSITKLIADILVVILLLSAEHRNFQQVVLLPCILFFVFRRNFSPNVESNINAIFSPYNLYTIENYFDSFE